MMSKDVHFLFLLLFFYLVVSTCFFVLTPTNREMNQLFFFGWGGNWRPTNYKIPHPPNTSSKWRFRLGIPPNQKNVIIYSWWFRHPANHQLVVFIYPVNWWDIHYQPQLVIAGFLPCVAVACGRWGSLDLQCRWRSPHFLCAEPAVGRCSDVVGKKPKAYTDTVITARRAVFWKWEGSDWIYSQNQAISTSDMIAMHSMIYA